MRFCQAAIKPFFKGRGRAWVIAALLPLTVSLASCGLLGRGYDAGAAPAATATIVLVPTFTPTPVEATATPTVVPAAAGSAAISVTQPLTQPPAQAAGITATVAATVATTVATTTPVLLPTATLAAEAAAPPGQFTLAADANLRSGPGTDYPLAGSAPGGTVYPVQGRNAGGDWLYVCCVNEQPVWVYAPLGALSGVLETLAVIATRPLPTPEAIAAVPTVAPSGETTAAAPPAPAAAPPAAPAPATGSSPYPPGGPIVDHPGTAGDFFPDAQYQIVHFKVLGEAENNGGIFNSGGQHLIFVTVLDQAGNGVDGVVLKDAIGDKLNVVTGNKGPGKTEIEMYWDGYKLYVASDSSGPVTSQISNRLNLSFPHLSDVIGKLGSLENDVSVCPTAEVRCEPPFYHVHFSYEITFQKVR